MTPSETFRQKIETFLSRTEMPPTSFGREAVGDGNFVSDLRDGRMPSLRLVERVENYIKSYKERAGA
jgi:hypothetical protein